MIVAIIVTMSMIFNGIELLASIVTIPHYLSATQARLEISSSNGGKLPALSVFQSVAERLADWQTSADHRIFLMRADGRS